jgi:uncharacterized Zn-finger protein
MFRRSDLIGHDNLVHKKIGIFECFECDNSFNDNSDLLRHFVKVHQGKTDNQKTKNMSAKEQLTESTSSKDDNEEMVVKKKLKCRKCVKTFKDKTTFLRHYKVDHHTTDIWICDICDIVFNTEKFLERHNRVHDPNRPHKCPHCVLRFLNKTHRKRHIEATHMKLRPFPCRICGAEFTQQVIISLKVILKVHF